MKTRKAVAGIVALLAVILPFMVVTGGCTSASVKIALDASTRVREVQDHIFEVQQDGLKQALFEKLLLQITQSNDPAVVAALLNRAWQDRDLLEFWAVQWERARALHIIGVDQKLYADQGILDLLWKQLSNKGDEFWVAVKSQLAGDLTTKALTPGDK